MSKNELDILTLEQEIASVENDALAEEQVNANYNYSCLENEMHIIEAQLPYPDVTPYTTGIDYEHISTLQYKKAVNLPFWEKIDALRLYCNCGDLYSGHIQKSGGWDYYFTDEPYLKSRQIGTSGKVYLINTDDKQYTGEYRAWQYPDRSKDVTFSRKIVLKDRKVTSVDVVLDRDSSVLSNISDAYLRKALIRNKSVPGMQSIIQTIQKKQDDIRSLPVYSSFVVQGCAGSGKTMVLLHRLRYLLFNNDIENGDYVLLVPGNVFKNFIKGIAAQFKINLKAVYPYQEYYRMMLGRSSEAQQDDVSELVFDKKYLARVYSREFMQESYKPLLDTLWEQTNSLIELCEDKLNELLAFEELLLDEEIEDRKKRAVSEVAVCREKLRDFIEMEIKDFSDIELYISKLTDAYSSAKKAHDILADPDYQITVSPDDERILGDAKLQQLRKDIASEQTAVDKASVFTVKSHKAKLEMLNNEYEEAYRAVEQVIIEEEKRIYADRAAKSAYVFDGITIGETQSILEELTSIYDEASLFINEAQSKKDDLVGHLEKKFNNEIGRLNELVEISSDIPGRNEYCLHLLKPCSGMFTHVITCGRELINAFEKHLTAVEKDVINNQLKLFSDRTSQQQDAYLNTRLFNACKKKIKDEFGIKLCDLYKHYWYIRLYCRYLTRSTEWDYKRYIFMDEAQDLSVSEMELIYKINSYSEIVGEFGRAYNPTVNVFGDVNQMITEHGIRSWDSIDFIDDIYELNENFRNPNQIVDFCNSRLSFHMEKIGVDMEPVSEYETLSEALSENPDMKSGTVLIVKDEYAEEDLKLELVGKNMNNFSVYTIKSVKGLEFKEVYVFDRGMSDNEKYIAYSRALTKLNVIKTLPRVFDASTRLYIDGEDNEE